MNKFLIKTDEDIPFYKRRLFLLIMSSIFVIIFIILIIIALNNSSKENQIDKNIDLTYIPYICLDNNMMPSNKCVGGWFYNATEYSPEYNAQFAKSKNWNYILLSTNNKTPNAINIIQAFRNEDISVHLMTLQDTKYLYDPKSAYNKIKDILVFVNDNNLDIQGIHIDVEPHAISEWKNGDSEIRTKIFQNYTKILEICRKAINDYRSNITFSAAVAWFYPSKTKKNEILDGRGYDLVNKNRLDFVFPMVYDGAGGTIERIIKNTNDYINDNANTVIGLAIKDYNETLDEMINQVFERRQQSKYFHGISIFSNHHYSNWGK